MYTRRRSEATTVYVSLTTMTQQDVSLWKTGADVSRPEDPEVSQAREFHSTCFGLCLFWLLIGQLGEWR
jgi:hypothetical protein